jgi:hypothetical protein
MKLIALFAEAEKGNFEKGVVIYTPADLLQTYGHPPKDTKGMLLAIQALHYQHHLLFFRVKDEGFSAADYRGGLNWMEENLEENRLGAIFAPGVGSVDILDPLFEFSLRIKALLMTTERDFYDYLTV